MKQEHLLFTLAMILLLLILAPVGRSQETQPAEMSVERITIEGNEHVPLDEIKKALPFKAGDSVTEDEIKAGSQKILDLGYFQQVLPDYHKLDGGVEVLYVVEENPLVKTIEITGNEEYKQYFKLFGIQFPLPLTWHLVDTDRMKEILKEHQIEEGKILNVKKLQEGLQAILEEYQKKGYSLIRVGDVQLGEEISITFIEGKIESVAISGVDQRLEEVARGLITIPLGKPLKIEAVQASFRRINNSIYFAPTEISDLSFTQGSGPDKVLLTWNLRERQLLAAPTEVKTINFRGNTIYSNEQLSQALGPLPQGKIDNLALLQVLQGVHDLYYQNGWTMMDLANGGVADGVLTVEILEGVIDGIIIKGNTRTKEYVIRKELRLHPGDIFNENLLRASYLNLQKLEYFQDIGVDFQGKGAGHADLILTVVEKEKLGSFGGALTYAEGGIVGQISLSWKNLFGTGQDLSLGYDQGLLGNSQANWHLDYSTTSFFSHYDFFKASLFRTTEEGVEEGEGKEGQAYTISRTGGEISLGYPFGPETQLTLSNRYEQFRECSQEGECEPPGTTNAVTVGLTSDNRDNADFPTEGGIRNVTLEQAGAFTVGTRFTKLTFTLVQHFSTLKDQSVALRLYGGLGFSLPTQEEFSLGGVGTLRGVNPFRAERFVLLNTEYRVKLIPEVVGVLFLDLGRGEIGNTECSFGLEGRATAPYLGLVRFVFAWPVVEGHLAWAPKFEFGFGQMF